MSKPLQYNIKAAYCIKYILTNYEYNINTIIKVVCFGCLLTSQLIA